MSDFLDTTFNTILYINASINDDYYDWRLNPLPSHLSIADGTSADSTVIDINGDGYYIERVQPSMIGTLPVASFIYMIMTFLVIIIMAYTVKGWIEAVVTQRTYEYTFFLPTTSLTERRFSKQLKKYYPDEPAQTARPSYAETLSGNAGVDCTPEGLRSLRELIRGKYAMDVRIWNSRFVQEKHVPTVEDWKIRSRGATLDMLKAVKGWMDAREQWTTEEWAQVIEINQRISQLELAERVRRQTSND